MRSETMFTFAQFLAGSAAKAEAVNTLFEERLFDLVSVLHKITDTLEAEHITYELIGGLAVLIHVEEANPEYTTLTRDVDLMVHRFDLEKIKESAAKSEFRFRHAAGVDMLLYRNTGGAKNPVRLIFTGERVRPSQAIPNPPIAPEKKRIHGLYPPVFLWRTGECLIGYVLDSGNLTACSFGSCLGTRGLLNNHVVG